MGLLLGILLPCLLKRLPVGLSKAQGPDRPCGSAGRASAMKGSFRGHSPAERILSLVLILTFTKTNRGS